MPTTHYTTNDIAAELNRLCPSQVNETISGNGQQESGHIGHDDGTVGWFTAGGNVGHPVLQINEDDISECVKRLKALPDGALDGKLAEAGVFAGLRIEWLV